MKTSIALVLGLALASQTLSKQKPSFEVATIKQNISGQDGGGIGLRGDRLLATNVSLRTLVNYAYAPEGGMLLMSQIIGGPAWTNTDRFDIEAKVNGDIRSIPRDRVGMMLQSLLEDRCQLKAHLETRELPVYDFVVAKGGLKVKPSTDQSPPQPGTIHFSASPEQNVPLLRGDMSIAGNTADTMLTARAVHLSQLLSLLQGGSDRIIVDKTNIGELFDFNLRYSRSLAPVDADSTSGSGPAIPSLFTAIQELGLKLEPSKAMLDVIVIDSVQKPKQD